MSEMSKDELICMKMMTRYKELRRLHQSKPHPDVGWMQELLDVVREYDVTRIEDNERSN